MDSKNFPVLVCVSRFLFSSHFFFWFYPPGDRDRNIDSESHTLCVSCASLTLFSSLTHSFFSPSPSLSRQSRRKTWIRKTLCLSSASHAFFPSRLTHSHAFSSHAFLPSRLTHSFLLVSRILSFSSHAFFPSQARLTHSFLFKRVSRILSLSSHAFVHR